MGFKSSANHVFINILDKGMLTFEENKLAF